MYILYIYIYISQAICERASWIWSAAPRPKQNYVAVGCNDGTVAVYQLVFATVHGLYQERYVCVHIVSVYV